MERGGVPWPYSVPGDPDTGPKSSKSNFLAALFLVDGGGQPAMPDSLMDAEEEELEFIRPPTANAFVRETETAG